MARGRLGRGCMCPFCTPLGPALRTVNASVNSFQRRIRETTAARRGDWSLQLIFISSHGIPTNELE